MRLIRCAETSFELNQGIVYQVSINLEMGTYLQLQEKKYVEFVSFFSFNVNTIQGFDGAILDWATPTSNLFLVYAIRES